MTILKQIFVAVGFNDERPQAHTFGCLVPSCAIWGVWEGFRGVVRTIVSQRWGGLGWKGGEWL